MTNINLKHIIKYSIAYRLLLAGVFFILLASIPLLGWLLLQNGSTVGTILLTVLLIFVCIALLIFFKYMQYVFRWRAMLSQEGIQIVDPIRGTLDFHWAKDVIVAGNFNLYLIAGQNTHIKGYEANEDYKISKWISGQRSITESNIDYIENIISENSNISEEDQAAVINAETQMYDDFFFRNLFNIPYLGYCFSIGTAGVLLIYTVVDILYFRTWVAIVLSVAVALQLTVTLQYMTRYSRRLSLWVSLSALFSVVVYAFIMYDNVHAKSEFFFLKIGMLFSVFATLFIGVFTWRCRIPIYTKLGGPLYIGVFVMFSLFFTSSLKAVNMVTSERPAGWEQGIAHFPYSVLLVGGGDPDHVDFDNREWGRRHMGLFFFNKREEESGNTRIEIQTFEGRLGVPWFYNNYHRSQSDKARLIK